MTNEEEDELLIQKEVNFYFNKNIPIVIEMRNGYKYSGKIISTSVDFFELNDRKGYIPIFYRQVRYITPVPTKSDEEQ